MAAIVSIPLHLSLACGRASPHFAKATASRSWRREGLDLAPRAVPLTLAAALVVPARRRFRDEGRWLAATGQDAETVLVKDVGLDEDGNQSNQLRFGVTDSLMLSWISERLQSLCPDVQFSGIILANEVGARGQEELANLQDLLESEEIDFIVLPAKDVALSLPSSLSAAAILREDAREAVVVRPGIEPVTSLSELPPGSTVCVSCARRRLQITSRFPSLNVIESSLPAQSQLRRLYSLDFDAVVAAVAGLQRTGLSEEVSPLKFDEVMPALCQGAVTMLCRREDEEILSLLADGDDPTARLCVVAERDLLHRLCVALPDGAAVAGLAHLSQDGRLSMQGSIALSDANAESRVVKVDMEGPADDWQALTQNMADALLSADETQAAFSQDGQEARARSPTLADEEEDADTGDNSAASTEALPAVGPSDRISVGEIDGSGRTAYGGRVCGYLANRHGLLVDINCEFPAFWYPEHESESSSSSSSKLSKEEPWQLWRLGSDVEVYCCAKHAWYLRVVPEPPLRLAVRGGIPRLKLEQLQPGHGPWRAVVISSTRDGTLVDFNCELPGLLQSDRLYVRGEEARVYCMKVDKERRVCVVTTAKELPSKGSERRRLEDLASEDNSVGLRGTVLNVTGNGVFIDVNCEVRGYVSPMDIDLSLTPNGLYKGFEVTVYIKSVHLGKRQVRLSMFPAREPVRVLGLK